MKRNAKNFYLGIGYKLINNDQDTPQRVPYICNLVYTEKPYEYDMTFLSYFTEKEKVIYVLNNELQIQELPKGERMVINLNSLKEIEIVFLNFDHFYITHSPNPINANVLILPEGAEYYRYGSTPFFIYLSPPNIVRVHLYNAANIIIANRKTMLANDSMARERSFLKYYNLDKGQYEIISLSDIDYE